MNKGDISTDLTWVDMLKGIAIIGVFFLHWLAYMKPSTSPEPVYSVVKIFQFAVGPFVQFFFILSGFGLTITYLQHDKVDWSWQKWIWRRVTKIVVPYEMVVILSFLLGMLGSYLYETVQVRFSWSSLLAFLTFTQNFYPPSWIWNPPLWFMPVIIGLYACFPILLGILRKSGTWALLFVSLTVTYGTLAIASLAGYTGGHNNDLFTFWLFQFVLGMVLAYERWRNPQRLRILVSSRAFAFGIGLVMCSWALRTYVPLGKVFNDSLTSIGVFLVLLNAGWVIRARIPAVGKSLNALSGKSYLMYLIHFPVMVFLVGPPLRVTMNPIIVVVLGVVYISFIFFLCNFISRPVNKFTSLLYGYAAAD